MFDYVERSKRSGLMEFKREALNRLGVRTRSPDVSNRVRPMLDDSIDAGHATGSVNVLLPRPTTFTMHLAHSHTSPIIPTR